MSRGDDMQIAADATTPQSIPGSSSLAEVSTAASPAFSQYKIIRRNGAVVGFEPCKISVALTKAFLAVEGGQSAASARIRELVAALTDAVVSALVRRQPAGGTFHIEDVQDQVELALMRSGEHEVARAYVLYREKRSEARAHEAAQRKPAPQPQLHTVEDGVRRPLDLARIEELIASACEDLGEVVDPKLILAETLKNIYDGVPADEVRRSAVLSARALIEKDPAYSYVTARLLLHTIRREVLGEEVLQAEMKKRYAEYFTEFVARGIRAELLDERLAHFDLKKLGAALDASRDLKFGYLGLQTLYDRYFLHIHGTRIELPQAFFMRVAMGLALNEIDRETRAIEFYNVLSSFDFMSSTPTLFNSGTTRSQLSSCYLTTVSDNLDGIYEAIKENALLAKYAGGLGNDWTPVRALGSHIKGTNGKSQGVVPFLKVVNDTAVAVNQGGKRKGELKLYKRIPATQLWRKMLSMLFETGHPWITFKDPCNLRSPQQHVGVVHSSNLCTEITLNTNNHEIAVCNLGSVNMVAHMQRVEGTFRLDHEKLKKTVGTAMRMLDNVIDINYYAVRKARDSNMKHRPVGLGIMGFQDCLHLLRIPYASQEAVEFADRSMEAIAYFSYWASTELAEERGRYASYKGSLWDRGILPQDTLNLLREERGGYVDIDMSESMDWKALRERIKRHGMRNSNCLAIAPTATIANIVGVSASIEPTFQTLFVKSNLSGECTVVNEYLVSDLKKLGLWDEVMVADLKYFDGNLARIDRVPSELRRLYATAFEVEPVWIVEAGARRQKWIDQSQSLNIYIGQASGKRLDESYKLAWQRGLKTTYYLRAMGATHAEKSTVRAGQLNAVPAGDGMPAAGATAAARPTGEAETKYCKIDDPECESCQ